MVMKRLFPLGVVVLALVVSAGFTASNTTAPDMQPNVDVADSIIGSWVLNREKSDDPREALEESGGGDSANRTMRRGGRRGGSSSGRRPRSTSTEGRQARPSPEQRQRIQASMRDALRAAPRIQISRTDSTVTLETPQGNRILFTDNREITIPVAADLDAKLKCKWDKDKLVIESETDAGVKTKYTYEPDGDQLKVDVRIQVQRPRQVIRYKLVYDAAG